jgi:hypothetical protein
MPSKLKERTKGVRRGVKIDFMLCFLVLKCCGALSVFDYEDCEG